MTLQEEIFTQPAVLVAALDQNQVAVDETARWMGSLDFNYVLAAARGTSDNAARYLQYLWGAKNRLNVALAAPALFGPFQSPPRINGALTVGISQSGESPDLLSVLTESQKQGRPTLAITNKAGSPMARLADRAIDIQAGPEEAVAATKTYTTQLLAIAMLSASLADDSEMAEAFAGLSPAVAQVLRDAEQVAPAVEAIAGQDRCVVVGRGFHHATSHEWALKIAELAYLVAQPFSSADFRHGPVAMVEPGLAVLAVATTGPMFDDLVDLLIGVRSSGAVTVTITDDPRVPSDHRILIPSLPEWLSPIPAVVAAQLFSYQLALARGVDPDHPRGLRKVTKTI
ncbi:MAG TPA: SIS domain-containing protein [Acidimicrobiia bacterium]